MSFDQSSCLEAGSTDSPITLTFLRSNSGLIFAMYPSSVVQTGVKSFGCENSTAHESPIQSWKWIGPSELSASKSGAISPSCSAISISLALRRLTLRSMGQNYDRLPYLRLASGHGQAACPAGSGVQ